MKVAKRRQAILELVLAGHTNVETLCRHLEVSEATVRRDLTALAEEGRILRTYGGATHIGTREPEPSLEQRSSQSGPGESPPRPRCPRPYQGSRHPVAGRRHHHRGPGQTTH
ncbi:DNA-binding transcriptional MocR family regulator [Pseudomonas psychrotolerans]|nr:DNA-binding transcriptional MocR family regulator [Pseudomonas psychrotolerans]